MCCCAVAWSGAWKGWLICCNVSCGFIMARCNWFCCVSVPACWLLSPMSWSYRLFSICPACGRAVDWVLLFWEDVKLLDMLEPLEVSCEGGHGLTTEVTFYDLAEGWGFCTGGDGLAPILFQHEEAVMDHVPHDASLEASRDVSVHAEHLQPSYRLTCDQGEDTVILRLERVGGKHPASIQWSIPIQPSHFCTSVQFLDRGTLEVKGRANLIINT